MEEWKEVKLGNILNFRRGHDLPRTKMKPGTIPVAGSNGIIGYHDEATPISPCITIGRSGNVGTPFIYEHCWAHNTVLYVDDFKGNNPWYLYYLLKTLPLSSFGGGSAVPTLNRNHIHPLEVKYTPDKNLQQKIVNILRPIDDKITINNKLNSNLEQQAKAIFKSWFIGFEPFKNGKFVKSELGMIPEGWEVGILKDAAYITMGVSPKGSSYNTIGNGEVFYQGRAEFGFRFPHRNLFTTEPKRFADVDSTLLSVRAPVGDINIANERCCIGRGLASVKSKSNYNSYVYYLLKSLARRFEKFNEEGTVFGNINKESLENMKILVPPQTLVERFDKTVHPLDAHIRNNEEESMRLSSLRDTLLPKLMSGELKV